MMDGMRSVGQRLRRGAKRRPLRRSARKRKKRHATKLSEERKMKLEHVHGANAALEENLDARREKSGLVAPDGKAGSKWRGCVGPTGLQEGRREKALGPTATASPCSLAATANHPGKAKGGRRVGQAGGRRRAMVDGREVEKENGQRRRIEQPEVAATGDGGRRRRWRPLAGERKSGIESGCDKEGKSLLIRILGARHHRSWR